jgi:hypothetical protein
MGSKDVDKVQALNNRFAWHRTLVFLLELAMDFVDCLSLMHFVVVADPKRSMVAH